MIVLASAAVPGVGLLQADLAAVVESMPNCDKDGKYTGPAPDVAMAAIQDVLKGGKENIVALVGMLKEPGKDDDYKANYLLHATATHVRRPGADEERRMVCEALVSTLDAPHPAVIKQRILEELLWIGGKEPIDALAKLALDPELYDYAIRALQARKALEPLRAAQPKAKGRNRAALIQALSVLCDTESVPAIIEAAGDADAAVRLAAVEALGNIGDARGVDAVLAAAKLKTASYEEMKCAEAALRLAQRLIDAGKKDEAKRIYTTVSKAYPGKYGRHVRSGCLQGLAAVAGDEVMTELLAAMADPDPQVRAVAARMAASLPGGGAVDKWLDLLKKAPPQDRAGILFILGAIGDAKALLAVLEAMEDKDPAVRLEAMRSAAALGGKKAAEALVARLVAGQGQERATALDSLVKSRGPEANPVVAAAAKEASDPQAKAALIAVLGARRASDQMDVILAAAQDKDAPVRLAAAQALSLVGDRKAAEALVKMLKDTKDDTERQVAEDSLLAVAGRAHDQAADAVVPALQGASPEASAVMFRALVRAGGGKAAKALVASADSPDAKIKDEAIRALSGWRENNGMAEAQDGLLKIAKAAEDPKHQAMALRQYANLARQRYRRNSLEQAQACGEALQIAKRPDDKRFILGILGDVQRLESLKLAAPFLDDNDVAEEAAAAVVRVAARLGDKADPEVQAALKKIVEVSKNKGTVDQAKRLIIKQ